MVGIIFYINFDISVLLLTSVTFMLNEKLAVSEK